MGGGGGAVSSVGEVTGTRDARILVTESGSFEVDGGPVEDTVTGGIFKSGTFVAVSRRRGSDGKAAVGGG